MRALVRASAAITCLASLVACGAESFEVQEGFFGGVAADEPRAALVMRDILVEGGRAVDAAVAGYFALSVTLPTSAGLAATGSCVVFDPSSKRFERLEFPALPSATQKPVIALPLAPRAMFAMHARYGRLRFEQLITDAEQLARFGEPVSARLAADLRWIDPKILSNPAVSSVLGLSDGKMVKKGKLLIQNTLGATLGRLRSAGIGDLYSGLMSRQFVEAVRALGYKIDPALLRDALPAWSDVSSFEHDNHNWAVTGTNAKSIRRGTSMLSKAFSDSGWSGLDQAAKAVLLTRVTRDVSARDGGPTPPDVPGATSFMAIDRTGQTVACVIGMGAPLGLGNVASGAGIFLRSAIDAGPGAALAVIAGNRNTWQLQLAATAGGGEAAYSTLVQTVLNHYEAGQSVAAAIESPRIHPDPGAGILYVEDAMGAAVASGFSGIGLSIKMSPTLGFSALFRCVDGLSKSNTNCDLAGDPRGGGLVLFEREK
ncbi:MAG: gamma-glutamyltransferase [Alphaproteobacteria bacterium]|nr:gamma-glutamyltransferase [Alphaproteobacteria bacterium]